MQHLEIFFMEKSISAVADGAPSFLGPLQNVLGVFEIHCVIHRQHLIAKYVSSILSQPLQFVINVVDKIQSNALNSRLIAQL